MTETTLAFRVPPPLYGLQDAEIELTDAGEFERIRLRISLVDSGAPRLSRVVTRGAGSGVTLPGDNLGVLHSTRFDVTIPGAVAAWTGVEPRRLAQVANRVIDWYRLLAGRPSVRRVAENSIGGYEARDSDGGYGVAMHGLGAAPGDRSSSAAGTDDDLLNRLRSSIERPLPLWAALCLDAHAELLAGQHRVAVLLANVSMETLVNLAFRAVASSEEVESAFSSKPPLPFWQLLKKVNAIVDTGLSNTQLLRLAGHVHQYRDDVSHGNPVVLDSERVVKAINALWRLGRVLDPAVVSHIRAAEAAGDQ